MQQLKGSSLGLGTKPGPAVLGGARLPTLGPARGSQKLSTRSATQPAQSWAPQLTERPLGGGATPRRRCAACCAAPPGGSSGGPSPTSSVDFGPGPSSSSAAGASNNTSRGAGGASPVAASAAATAAGVTTATDASTTSSTSSSSNGTAAAPARRTTHGGLGASAASMEEQERELQIVTSDLPRAEARLEVLAFWVGAAVAFGGGIWYVQGAEKAQEFFAGYILEQSLSVDNLFVFVLVFNYFKTPTNYQPKVLTYGLATAAVLRATMILLGTELVEKFQPVLLGFALVLLWSAYGLLVGDDEEDEGDLSNNNIVKICRSILPVTDHYDGDKFFTTAAAAGGAVAQRVATPLLLSLAVVEISDVVFAVDSIPAVFGVTHDPFIVYTSNMLAILSLRSLYSFVSTVMTELRFLDKSVAVVLAFIGGKMIAEFAGVEVPTDVSLLVVGLLLGGGVAASLLLPEEEKVE